MTSVYDEDVRNTHTTNGITFDEAMSLGLVNIKESIFIEPTTHAKMPLESAIRHGLLIIPSEGITITVTTETTSHDQQNNQQTEQYCDNIGGASRRVEMISFRDAVNRGYSHIIHIPRYININY